MQLKIDALKEAAARPGAGAPAVPASQLTAAGLYQQGHRPARLYAGRGPGQRKGNAMMPTPFRKRPMSWNWVSPATAARSARVTCQV